MVAGRFFDPGVVQPAVRVLGAVSACVRRARALHADELRRLADAKRVIRLLGCCRFLLGNHLRCVRQFAIAKACYTVGLRVRLLERVAKSVHCYLRCCAEGSLLVSVAAGFVSWW